MANKRLIDANKVFERADEVTFMGFRAEERKKHFMDLVSEILKHPTVDAVEVVHANWIEDGYYGNPFVCSHCGSEGCYSGDYHNKQYYYTNYCPNCGAKMDGGNEDG